MRHFGIALVGLTIKRQSGPVEPDTDVDCSYYDTAFTASDNCQYFKDYWGMSHADFVAWNPSVKNDCSGIKVGNSYCVKVTQKAPPPTPTPTTSATPTLTKAVKPKPTQDGLIELLLRSQGGQLPEDCEQKIANKFGTFSTVEFIKWNPAVGEDCSGIWAETYYCVGIPGTSTVRPGSSVPLSTYSTLTSLGNGVTTPLPTQPGMVSNCKKFHWIVKSVVCSQVISYQKITLAQFVEWNPTVGNVCSVMWAEVNVCVGVIGGETTKPTPTPSLTTSVCNGVQTPMPKQPGMVANCNKFHWIAKGVVCSQVISY